MESNTTLLVKLYKEDLEEISKGKKEYMVDSSTIVVRSDLEDRERSHLAPLDARLYLFLDL